MTTTSISTPVTRDEGHDDGLDVFAEPVHTDDEEN